MLRDAFAHTLDATTDMIRFGSMLEDLECYVDNSIVWSEDKGRIVGRRGGIRQWLRKNTPDLSERYKAVMKYKALAKRFRQAVGICDPIPAAAVLPPEQPRERDVSGMAGKRREKGRTREYCSENSRRKRRQAGRSETIGERDRVSPVEVAKVLLESYVCSRHVLCDIISHGVLSRGWMILLGGFHHTTDCGAFVGFSRDAPMGACLSSLFLPLPVPVFLLQGLLPPPRQLTFPI